MNFSFYYTIDLWIISVVLFILLILSMLAGRQFGMKRGKDYADNPANTAIVGSVYALMGLMFAFTFGMSGGRFDERKHVIVEEANCISTAILRLDLYADSVKPLFRKNFKDYLEARIAYYNAKADTALIRRSLEDRDRYSIELWKIAATNSRIGANLVASNQMIPALNQMFDISNTRFWGEYDRTPSSILTMLFSLSLIGAFMMGYTSAGKGKFDYAMAVAFCFLIAMVIFFIIDLDKPRRGIITVDRHAKAIVDLRTMLD